LSSLQQLQLCGGLPVEEPFNTVAADPSSNCSGNIVLHTVPINAEKYDETGPFSKQKSSFDQMIAIFSLLRISAQIARTKNNRCKSH
jgi:hypothetical protein